MYLRPTFDKILHALCALLFATNPFKLVVMYAVEIPTNSLRASSIRLTRRHFDVAQIVTENHGGGGGKPNLKTQMFYFPTVSL